MKRQNLWTRVAMLLLASASSAVALASDQIPGEDPKQPVLLRNAKVYPVSGPAIDGGSVLIEGGIIRWVGAGEPPEAQGALKVDLEGKHLYPGLIESFSQIGLIEIESVRATIDTSETGEINSNVRTQVAFNPDSEAIPVARANGVLLALTVPSGGWLSGKSSLMRMDGWTYEDIALVPTLGMHLQWPRFSAPPISRRGRGGGGAGGDLAPEKRLEELQDWIDKSRLYGKAKIEAPGSIPYDARLEGMLDLVDGKIPMIVDAADAAQIQSAISFARSNRLKLILYGGLDADQCAPLLKETQTPVIVGGVYRVPRTGKPYDEAYTLPSRLRDQGIRFCISGSGRFSAANVRNLPYHAAMASAHGLTSDEALRAITLSAAEVLGVADRVGSIEVGKEANLFVADGDILEIPTQVTAAWIRGRPVDLTNHHTELYRKYQTKYDRIQPPPNR
jgi:imidazolonepropionase-like amidohydrolase